MLLSEIARSIGGTLCGEDREITGASTIEEAQGSDITFLANPKYKDKARTCAAGGIIVGEDLGLSIPQIMTPNPYLAFAMTLELLYPERSHEPGISDMSFVHPDASVDESATIYPFVSIGRKARVAQNCIIHPGCVVGDEAVIGRGTILYRNVVVYDRCRIGEH